MVHRIIYLNFLMAGVYLSSMHGANSMDNMYGSPWMLGSRVVSLAMQVFPEGFSWTWAATISLS